MLLYRFLMLLLLPFFFLGCCIAQLIAGRKEWYSRFGIYRNPSQYALWIHAASLGEINAAVPLIRELKQRQPNVRIIITSVTATGLEQAQRQFATQDMHCCYPPYDLPFFIHRFVQAFDPQRLIVMEADIWPSMLRYCGQRNIPRFLVNARLTPESACKRKARSSIFPPLNTLVDVIYAQTQLDAQRFASLDVNEKRIKVCGNLKFDMPLDRNRIAYGRQLRALLGRQRRVWIAASTHHGEEAAAIAAHKRLLTRHPHSLLILVPRHPQRFAEVVALCRQSSLNFIRLSQQSRRDSFFNPQPDFTQLQKMNLVTSQILVGDTMGDLPALYASADFAFVGGSLVPRGGHNILEPARLFLPIILGPSDKNLTAVVPLFEQAAVMARVKNVQELADCVLGYAASLPVVKQRLQSLLIEQSGAAARIASHIYP